MTQHSKTAQFLSLAMWLGIVFVAAGLGSLASMQAGDFYAKLIRPDWAPPASVFGPVWSVLYLLMGIAAWLVWREKHAPKRLQAILLFLGQLVANALWTWLFFAWKNGFLAFAEIVLLLALIVATLISFWRIHRVAAALLLPYLVWVSFATALTWSIWRSNPSVL